MFNKKLTVKIFSLEGKEMMSENINTESSKISISHLAKGVYFISLLNETEITAAKKIIIN